MKRFCVIVCISMIAVLGLASFTWATEASVFDSAENILIRTCTAGTSAYLDVRDATGVLMPVNTFTVDGNQPAANPFQIHNDLTSTDLSMSFDNNLGTTYLFCTNSGLGLHVMKYVITNLANGHCGPSDGQTLTTQPSGVALCDTGTASSVTTTTTGWAWTCTGTTSASSTNPPKVVNCSANRKVDGACGSSDGGSFTSAPTSNLCSAGTASSVSGTGPWSWSCNGSNGGTTASCSATLKVNGACGTDNGSSFTSLSSTDANLCASGTVSSFAGTGPWNWSCAGSNSGTTASCSATLKVSGACGTTLNTCTAGTFVDVADSGTNYLWTCTGSNGGTTANCSLPIPSVNGACGSSNGGTFTSAPTSNLCSAGTASSVSGTGPWSWTCNGSSGGTNASCSANINSGALPNLTVSVNGTTGGWNGGTFSMDVTISNTGSGPAGAFTVKMWFTYSGAVDSSAQLLYTWNVPGLAAGQSLTTTFTPLSFNGAMVHEYYYILTKVDADKQVTESNESDNTSIRSMYIYR